MNTISQDFVIESGEMATCSRGGSVQAFHPSQLSLQGKGIPLATAEGDTCVPM